jgi:hypothetical protein
VPGFSFYAHNFYLSGNTHLHLFEPLLGHLRLARPGINALPITLLKN